MRAARIASEERSAALDPEQGRTRSFETTCRSLDYASKALSGGPTAPAKLSLAKTYGESALAARRGSENPVPAEDSGELRPVGEPMGALVTSLADPKREHGTEEAADGQ
jgi:hypothetical protein